MTSTRRLGLALVFVASVAASANAAFATPGTVTIATHATLIDVNGEALKMHDTASLAGSLPDSSPTGTVTFNAYGPFTEPFSYGPGSCVGLPAYTSTNSVVDAGATSDSFFPPTGAKKLYLFTAGYSGDANYAPVESACDAAGEAVEVPAVGTSGEEFVFVGAPSTGPPGAGSGGSSLPQPGAVQTVVTAPIRTIVLGHAYVRRVVHGRGRQLRVARGAVVLASAARRVVARSAVSAGGAFALTLTPGRYTLSVRIAHVPSRQCSKQEVAVGASAGRSLRLICALRA